MTHSPNPLLSIAIPVYRTEEYIPLLCQQLIENLSGEPYVVEIILVDDACPDSSWLTIQRLCDSNPSIKGIKLSRNYGQQTAISAGLFFAKGEYVIILDCDLQHPISAIPSILRELEAGNDIVYTVSKRRDKKIDEVSSALFWFFLNKSLRRKIVPNQLMMRGMSARFIKQFNRYPEVTRSVAGISHDIGLKHSVLKVESQRRIYGRSSYNFLSRFELMIDIVLGITTRPLSIIITTSFLVLLGTLAASIYYIFMRIFQDVPSGFTTIVLLLLFFGSTLMLILGVLGVYMAKIYEEVRRRPVYIIDKRINCDEGHN
jgi:glycosyltransferase involved in cell wall biosynthesis